MHHPFTSPDMTAAELKAGTGRGAESHTPDMVINGYEVGGGSVRIHSGEMQQTVFGILGINRTGTAREVRLPAGCAGSTVRRLTQAAFGLDRLTMLTGTDNIRDVIAFENHRSGVSDDRRKLR